MRFRRTTLLGMALVFGASRAAAQGPSFAGLGEASSYYPGSGSHGRAVSDDGTVVAGRANARATVWGPGGPLQIPLTPAIVPSWALDVNADGTVVVGVGTPTGSNEDGGFVFRNGGLELVDHPAGNTGGVNGVAADGSLAVGQAYGGGRSIAFRWDDGVITDLVGPGESGRANDVSADGSTIGGDLGGVAVLWREGARTVLGPGEVLRLSADGAVAVGRAQVQVTPSGTTFEARIWRDGQEVPIVHLPGGDGFSEARGVSGDGTVVVGVRGTPAGNEAFLWDETHGMRPLRDVLVDDHGIDPVGWKLTQASGISADGITVVGSGVDPAGREQGWIARLVVPACRNGLDDDGDGRTDERDPGCASRVDDDEGLDCANGIDDDGDGLADYPADPGCAFPYDGAETSADLPCDDGRDGDGDLLVDFPADPGCASLTWPSESPACSNGVDDDADGWQDYAPSWIGNDLGCDSASDLSEDLDLPIMAVDLHAPGDGLLTRDPNSGLDWLDLTATLGLSMSDIDAGAGGLRAAGWRHAKAEEACTLFSRALHVDSLAPTWCNTMAVEPERVDAFRWFQSLVGVTQATPSVVRSSGWLIFQDAAGNAEWSETLGLGFPLMESSIGLWGPFYDVRDPAMGHLLVRPSPPACANGRDDDGDGFADFPADPECRDATDASEAADCSNGVDDDRDGFADGADPGCSDPLAAREDPACDDRTDDDGDGLFDAAEDPDCHGDPTGTSEAGDAVSCGLGVELLPLAIAWAARRRRVRA